MISGYCSANVSMLPLCDAQALIIVMILGGLPVFFIINVEAEGVHSQPQLRAFLVLDVKVVDPIHLQILGYLQVLHHSILSVKGRDQINKETSKIYD